MAMVYDGMDPCRCHNGWGEVFAVVSDGLVNPAHVTC